MLDGKFNWPRKGPHNDHAHPPIHPTKHVSNLQGDDSKVYEYIVRRFLACCSLDAEGEQTTVVIDIAGETFSANGKRLNVFLFSNPFFFKYCESQTAGLRVIEKNYLEVFTYTSWNSRQIPLYVIGETFVPKSNTMREGLTSPPNLLSEADLIATMDTNGIGTVFKLIFTFL